MCIALMLLLLAAACGGPEVVQQPPRVSPPDKDSPVSLTGEGGVARTALPIRPACLNPYLAACYGSEVLTGTIFESPLVAGPPPSYRPMLAEAVPTYESGTLSLEPLTVEVRLRRGVAFSDGERVTSADLKWTYEQAARLADEGGISPLYAGFERLARVETPDARTARLVFEEPYAAWQELLTAPILPRHVYEGRSLDELPLTEKPVGSGPFLLEELSKGGLSLVRNPRYWAEELPYLGGLEISFSGPRAVSGALSAGRADLGLLATGEIPGSGDLLRARAAPGRVEVLLPNARRLEDRGVRKAVLGAVAPERVAGPVEAPVAQSFVPPGDATGYVPAWEKKMKGSTTPPGSLDLVYLDDGEGPVRRDAAEKISSELADAGVVVNVRAAPPGEFFDAVLPGGGFDLALYPEDAAGGYAMLPALPAEGRAALRKSLAAADPEEHGRALGEAQRSLAEEAALLPLFVWPDAYAWSSSLQGPRPETPRDGIFWNVRDWAFFE